MVKIEYKKINKMIEEASTVFIICHKDLDLDALGACLGVYFYIENLYKKVYFILEDKKLEAAVDKAINEYGYEINFVGSEKARNIKNGNSLLIILDTNKEYLLQDPEISKCFEKKIIIDHHDKGEDTIEDGLIIIDSDASSTCEIITDFLKENNFVIDSKLATILLAGIILDTGNYVLKTDTNTFYYSYYLTTCGASPINVQYLLKQDIKKYIKRQKLITNVKVINNVAITKGFNKEFYKREEIAKTASSLLLFNNIEASFVIARLDKNTIGISGRSMGKMNIGQILSMFNGGGDMHEGAAKVENKTIRQIEQELLNIIKLL